MKNKTSQSGFTLIELIAVMVILGILAAVIIPRIATLTSGAYESNVRNMYGLIKNEVNAQAIKAAMSGGSAGHLETFPNPGQENDFLALDYYLKEWVDDYDSDMWSSFCSSDGYDNRAGATPDDVGAIVFMYHPHGKPSETIVWAEGDGGAATLDPSGTSTSLEDFYWIYYAPRTSTTGSSKGRELDGYVMAAWQSGPNMATALTFDNDINPAGATVESGDDIPIADLTLLVGD